MKDKILQCISILITNKSNRRPIMSKLISKLLLISFVLILFSGTIYTQEKVVEGKTEWDHGILFWKSNDNAFSGRFDTRMFLNGAYFFDEDNLMGNGTNLRKARLALKMKLWENWRTEWDIDVAEGFIEIKDMWFSYNGFNKSVIKVGHFKIPYGLEILTTSRYIPFTERAYMALAFKLGRRAAIEYSKYDDIYNVRATLFGQEFINSDNKDNNLNTGGGFALRVASAPLQTKDMIAHIGGSFVWERPQNDTWAIDKINAEPETKIGDVEFLNTKKIKDVNYSYRYGFEAALVYKSFHLQGEYTMMDVFRLNDAPQAGFNSWYAYLLYSITGESRSWDQTQGEFGQLVPKDNTLGAWEVGARASYISLTDKDAAILGGNAMNYTFALNWYPNPNMAMQLNFTMVDNDDNANAKGSMPNNYDFNYVQFMGKIFF